MAFYNPIVLQQNKCEDIEVTDNGKKMKKDSVKTIFGEDFSKVLKFSAYSDGAAYITMMDDENGAAWTKTKDKSYKISLSGAQAKEGESMTAKLDGKKLIIRSEDTYQSDGKDMTAEKDAFLYDFYVTPKNLVGAPGGFVFAKFSEWDKFAEKNSAGFKFYPMYSDGEIWITKSSGENFMGPRQFGSDDEKSIGYSYVKKK